MSEFRVTLTEGLTFARKAFTQIKDAKVRHHIVKLVGEIAGELIDDLALNIVGAAIAVMPRQEPGDRPQAPEVFARN